MVASSKSSPGWRWLGEFQLWSNLKGDNTTPVLTDESQAGPRPPLTFSWGGGTTHVVLMSMDAFAGESTLLQMSSCVTGMAPLSEMHRSLR